MLILNTLGAMRELGLNAMAQALELQLQQTESGQLTFEQRIGMLLDAEASARSSRKIERLRKQAHFKFAQAVLEDVDFAPRRKLDRSQVLGLGACDWIKRRQNLIITGPTGTGKSYLACAFGNQACRLGLGTYFITATALYEQLNNALLDRALPKLRRQLINTKLLIIDDFGLESIPAELEPILLEIVDLQSANGSLLLTSQFPSEHWSVKFTDPTIAEATLDRIVHRAHVLELHGESLRKLKGINI
jgi:DNA replication protein DnaC